MSEVDSSVEYRDVPGFPLYRVGSDGSLWSKHNGRHGIATDWKRIKGAKQRHGYLSVTMHDPDGSKREWVHRIIMLVFVGPCPPGKCVCHYDGNPSNNQLSNLRYGTPVENAQDTIRHGRHRIVHHHGEKHGMAKLSYKVANEIRNTYVKYSKKHGSSALARKYRVSQATVWRVIIGDTWVLE